MPIHYPLPAEIGALHQRFDDAAFAPVQGLEEVHVDDAPGMAAGLAFLIARMAGRGGDRRLVAFVAPRFWLAERGRPFAHGLQRLGVDPGRILVATPRTETESLWALEEVLRSGAASLAVGAVEGASLVATRRLDLIARGTGATAALIRTTPAKDLSAARRRWRIAPAPSGADPWDAKASGPARWRAVLERSRDGAGGETVLEFDDETHRLRLVDGLADHGLAPGAPTPRDVAA
jgi:protein ImuA